MTSTPRSIFLLVLTLFAASSGGCAAVSLATLGTVAGIAATAATTGADVYSLGKLDSAEMASGDAVYDAARRAGDDLGLTVVADEVEQGDRTVKFLDDQQAKLIVSIDPRSARLTRLRIDVGWFGSEPTARLMLQRVRIHLGAIPDPADAAHDDGPKP